ncbi:hypothetical protein FHX42_003898 [Saccharopolyspora lacisalsi]|uniref:Uncharacterized protein n=1 Tax=Halosaccharopolyspora lacisalsi TaxID=1000566 RepID=A0A839DX22_9PSEU|nr:hypothetical protein [Halosaccharopolyspora lacisalsi]
MYWLDRNEIDVMAGRCLIESGATGRAEPLLSRAIANYPQEHSRGIALYLSWLTESRARAGDPDAARETPEGERSCGFTVPSARSDNRLEAIERLLPAEGCTGPTVSTESGEGRKATTPEQCHRATSRTTGAWSDAPLPLRSSRST